MSLSTSNFDFPKLNGVLPTLISALATLVLLASLVIGFNLYMDPFDADRSSVRAERDRFAGFRHYNTAQWAAFDLAQIDPLVFEQADIILLGDSRVRALSGGPESDRVHLIDGMTVLDLAFGGASIQESLSVYTEFSDRFKKNHIVMVSSPYDRMRPPRAGSGRYTKAHADAKYLVRYLLNVNTFSYSIEGLSLPKKKRKLTSTPKFDDSYLNLSKCLNEFEPMEKELGKRNRYRRSIVALKPDEAESSFNTYVVPFINEVKINDGKPVLFFPKYSPRLQNFWENNMSDRKNRYFSKMAESAPIYLPSNHKFPLEMWNDDFHVCQPLGMMYLNELVKEVPDLVRLSK